MTNSNSNLVNLIKQNCDLQENGCLLWKRCLDKNLCRISYNSKVYFAHNAMWNAHNVGNEIDKKNEKCIRTCGDIRCLAVDHLEKVPLKQTYTKEDIWKRLLEKGNKLENGCLIWTGSAPYGYGRISIQNKTYSVHIISYWCNNDIDVMPEKGNEEKLMVRHLCNTPACFEPSHLKLGTQYENDFDDKIAHGTLQRGEVHYNSSITEEKAREIKLSKGDPQYGSQGKRAKHFEVSIDIVESIDANKSWAFIPDKNGNISSTRKIKARELRAKAKAKIWTPEMFEEAKERLFEKSEISDIANKIVTSKCRIWNGNISNGYGRISVHGKSNAVHVLACEIKMKRHVNSKSVVRHLCGNKLCCEPDHMQEGTSRENAEDTLKHGNCRLSKLTEDMVRQIRITNGKDGLTKKQRAEKYGTSIRNLREIEMYKSWKHVTINDCKEDCEEDNHEENDCEEENGCEENDCGEEELIEETPNKKIKII